MTLETRLWITGAVLAAGVLGGMAFRRVPEDPLPARIAALESSLDALSRRAAADAAAAKEREEEFSRALAAARAAADEARKEAAAAKAVQEAQAERALEATDSRRAMDDDRRGQERLEKLEIQIPAFEARIRTLEELSAESAAARPRAVPPEAPPLGPTAVRDPAHVRKVTDGLNALLAKVPGDETWRVASAEALDGDRLVDAVLEARDPTGEVRRTVRAREARFLLDGGARTLALRFREGGVTYPGTRSAPFPEDPFTVLLPVDPEPFRVSGNPLLTLR